MITALATSQYLASGAAPAGPRPLDAENRSAAPAEPARDRVEISAAGRRCCASASCARTGGTPDESLDAAQRSEVQRLKRRDQEVRAHEQAHMAAGAGVVSGGASYQYQRGPDGKMYAVGGEVKIDTSAEREPQDTIRKMQQVRKAALAPAQPSATDRSVAAQASQVESQARMEASRTQGPSGSKSPSGKPAAEKPGRPLQAISVFA